MVITRAQAEEQKNEQGNSQGDEQDNDQDNDQGNDREDEQVTTTVSNEGDVSMDDQPPTSNIPRDKKREMDDWAKEVIQSFAKKRGAKIQGELQSETPDFTKIENYFKRVNSKIENANRKHNAPINNNLLPETAYRTYYEEWSTIVNSASADPERGWKAYNELCEMFRLTNQDHHLPMDWNIPPDATEKRFGVRPANTEASSDVDSGVESSTESESKESDSEVDGINGLESRMRKEYSSLSGGKVLYWWRVGTGTQVFVRYGSKETPVYRVRAGSSQPYDPKNAKVVLRETRGTRKCYDKKRNQEVWEYTRHQVLDIIGVGWKIDDDDEANINPLASIRPKRYDKYPHTRALVKWKDGEVSLERRSFVRRITIGDNINGDRMINLKAKELEEAHRGYNIEEVFDDNSNSDGGTSDGSVKRRARSSRSRQSSSRRRRGVHFVKSESEGSDSDSEASQSRSRKHVHRRKSKKDMDIAADIRHLTNELKRLKVQQKRQNRPRSG